MVAGYVGTVEQWRLFEEILTLTNGADRFHGKEFFARSPRSERIPPYKGWSDDRAQRFLRNVLEAIRIVGVAPVCSAVDVIAFNAHSELERRFLTGASRMRAKKSLSGSPGQAYYLPFVNAMSQALDVTPEGDCVDVISDRHPKLSGYAAVLFNDLKEVWKDDGAERLGAFVFESRENAVPLDAADMLAHAWYSYTANNGSPPTKIRRAGVDQILSHQKLDRFPHFTSDVMDKLLGKALRTLGRDFTFSR